MRIARQGALLLGGSFATQVLAFGRNAVLAYGLSRGDFGIAAALMLTLQLIETTTEIAPDRFIVQAGEAGIDRIVAACHATQVARGLVCATVLYFFAGWIAAFFAVPQAAPAFSVMALVPLLRAFTHLDSRRRQRLLDNRASVLIELLPQATALLLAWPLLALVGGYEAAVALALVQALAGVVASHAMAERGYRIAIERDVLSELARFGWPLWIAGLPQAAVIHGERALVGRMIGMEALAGFAAATMLVAAIGTIGARLGQSLILPLLVAARGNASLFSHRLRLTTELSVLAAGAVIVASMTAGHVLMPLLFGPNYSDLGAVLGWLAVGAGLRIAQAPASLALMAEGRTQAFLTAAVGRALVLVPLAAAAAHGASLETLAIISAAAETSSLAMFLAALPPHRGLAWSLLARIALLATALGAGLAGIPFHGAVATFAAAAALAIAWVVAAALVMPLTRAALKSASGFGAAALSPTA